MSDDPLDQIVPIGPITIRQLHSMVGAIQVALVRYPLLLQLRRWDDGNEPLDHSQLRELRDELEAIYQEVRPVEPKPDPTPPPPIEKAKQLLGHRKIETTQRYASRNFRDIRSRLRASIKRKKKPN